MPIRIFVADDHDVVREGVKSLLKAQPDWEICGEAADGDTAIKRLKSMDCDVAIVDISMPGASGLDVTRTISALKGSPKILIFTMHDSKSLLRTAREAGARGLVLKSLAARDLIRAVQTLLDGSTFFDADGPQGPKTPLGFSPLMLLLHNFLATMNFSELQQPASRPAKSGGLSGRLAFSGEL